MRRRLSSIEARVLPRGWTDAIRQLLLGAAAYMLYEVVRAIVASNSLAPGYKPFGDATKIINFERLLHVFVEPNIQAWTLKAHWLTVLADWTYLNAHYLVTTGALVFIYVRRNRSFYYVRNMFMIAMAIGLVGYALYPTAPPRLLPEWGFTDTIQQFTGITVERGAGSALLNLYAAVPSMHVCFALMIGIPMSLMVRRWPARLAWRLYPVVITFVVVATGNHYFTDVFLGALTAGVSAVLAQRVLARYRPDVWSFNPSTSGPPPRGPDDGKRVLDDADALAPA
jgi:membrane-associated phospholipid phosphatase